MPSANAIPNLLTVHLAYVFFVNAERMAFGSGIFLIQRNANVKTKPRRSRISPPFQAGRILLLGGARKELFDAGGLGCLDRYRTYHTARKAPSLRARKDDAVSNSSELRAEFRLPTSALEASCRMELEEENESGNVKDGSRHRHFFPPQEECGEETDVNAHQNFPRVSERHRSTPFLIWL